MSSLPVSGTSGGCLSQQPWLLSQLNDLSAFELGRAVTEIRKVLASLDFAEVILSPLDTFPIDFLRNPVDVEGIGQLRFNTEPEIWSASAESERFYSISPLFRREATLNLLRRSAFFIIDIYQIGTPDSLLDIFRMLLDKLARAGCTTRLDEIPFVEAEYDPSIDGPRGSFKDLRWAITSGYDADHSFFEITEHGHSTRKEIFLATPFGFLEVGVVGLTAWNRNPDYILRGHKDSLTKPDLRKSGLGIGLERLLLCEQIASLIRRST